MNPAKSILLVPHEIPFIDSELVCLATVLVEAIGCILSIPCSTKKARELSNFGQLHALLSEDHRVVSDSPCPVLIFYPSSRPAYERVELLTAGNWAAPFLLSFPPRLLSLPNERLVLMSMANEVDIHVS